MRFCCFFAFTLTFVAMLSSCSKSINANKSPALHTNKKGISYIDTQETKTSYKKIAILFASKNLKEYAINLQNIAIAYTLSQNTNMHLTFKDFKQEKAQNLYQALEEINNLKIKKAILLITDDFKNTIDLDNDVFNNFEIIYLPANKKDINNLGFGNIVYGSIDYEKQIDILLQLARNDTNIISLYENNKVSKELNEMLNNKINVSKNHLLTAYTRGYTHFLQTYKDIEDSTIFLNTNQAKSAIALSQLITHNINATIILSTQINFSPNFLSTTQYKDRQKLFIANSLPQTSHKTTLLNDVELLYPNVMSNWVSYSILMGLEYIDKGEIASFDDVHIKNNSVIYPINLYYYTRNKYIKIDKFTLQDYNDFNSTNRELRWDSFHKLHKTYDFKESK